MKIVFFGNSDFSVKPFKEIIKHWEVCGLVTAPDSMVGRGLKQIRINPVKDIALQHGIPVLQPSKLKNNTEFYEELRNLNADLHIIVSYGKIIPKDMISIPRLNTINLHASLLPKLRGAAPIQFALWRGDTLTGNTVQFITEKMDEGDIIEQSFVNIAPEDTYSSLENKLAEDGSELLSQCVRKLEFGTAKSTPQDHSQATYTKLITKEDGFVFFSMSASEIVNTFRALSIRPGVFLESNLGNIKIVDCCESDICNNSQEGIILEINNEGIVVSCFEQSSILLKSLQISGKKPLSGKDFANGFKLKTGMLFPQPNT
ncbi:MAG: methionyl-tRNA formyltransferase [Brevinemataceae bacterium]